MNKTHKHRKKVLLDQMYTDVKKAPVNIRNEVKRRIQLISNKFRVYPENELSKELRLNFIEWMGDNDDYKFHHDPNRSHGVGYYDMYISPVSMIFSGPVHLNWCSKHKNSLHISTMRVLPDSQRQGFGKFMMFIFLTRIHTVVGNNINKFDLPKITLECMGNVGGQDGLKLSMSISEQVKFFESCGFVITKVTPEDSVVKGMTHMGIDWDKALDFIKTMVALYKLEEQVTND